MADIHKFTSKQEEFLLKALEGLDEVKKGMERGDIVSYVTVAYSPEYGVAMFYSKPENVSYYHLLGQLDVAKDYMLNVVAGGMVSD